MILQKIYSGIQALQPIREKQEMQNHNVCWWWTWTGFHSNLIKTKVSY